MQIKHLFLILTVICTLLLPSFVRAQQDEPQVVNIPDPNLAAAIRAELGVGTLTTHNLLKLRNLRAEGYEIEDLTGLEHAHNLYTLQLSDNNISDISPLAELKNAQDLRSLTLSHNNISDLSPLAGLTQVGYLHLDNNNISDISPLAELKKLDYLHLDNNNISDISPLAELKNLRQLHLDNNNISDISPLAELTQVERLWLDNNNISDISPLAELKKLETLLLYDNNISDISPLAGLIQLEQLGLRGNNISDISPLAGLTKLRLSWDILLYAKNLSELLPFAGRLERLTFSYKNISDISLLAEFKNLVSLDLRNNNISDVSPLAELTQLTSLNLQDNNISDLSPLTELKHAQNLRSLTLSHNNISDLSPLAELTQVGYLSLDNNNILDISPLAELTQLTSLNLQNNNILDISPLAELTQLTSLVLQNNNISDVSPLVGLINLKQPGYLYSALSLSSNPLSYASINTHIPAMQTRGIDVAFTERVPETLRQISGDAQQGGVNSALPLPFVVQVWDQWRRRFAGVPVTFSITAGEGELRATTVETDINGRAGVHLRMGATPGTITVRVTAPNISEPVEFTATVILQSEPVIVRDGNLRAKIMETLGKPFNETLTIMDMLQLQTLTADNMGIYDLTGLGYAANLKSLSLQGNRISNVAPLSGLTQLTTLDLRHNWISDMSHLRGSVHLKDADGLSLQGNPLSDTSLHTYIPLLQEAGVNVHFDGESTVSGPVVRLIYFLPRDRRPRPDINAQMDRLIKDIQTFYADEMERHGFGRKTFQFETDADGNAVVYHITGRDDDVDYHYSQNVWGEIGEQFDTSRNIYLATVDVSTEAIDLGAFGVACGVVGFATSRGFSNRALIPADGGCFNVTLAAHELGHTFHLPHDYRNDSYLMSQGRYKNKLSKCAAEWLTVNPYFNSNNRVDYSLFKNRTSIEMLSPSLESQPYGVRLRFKLNDPDGLHQAMLIKNTDRLLGCQSLNDSSSQTVDFVTTALSPKDTHIALWVIDARGNVTLLQSFRVDIAALLPPEKPVSIPDPNLAAAIREQIGDVITTHTMLNLTELYVASSGITDLTGLEHAHYLSSLDLRGNTNTVSDFSPLAGLTNLKSLNLSGSFLTDISSLIGLTDLEDLGLSGSNLSDISPLAHLTNLTRLSLSSNNLSDISPLANLTGLSVLYLNGKNLSDISPLANLTGLGDLNLSGGNSVSPNNISDVSPLANLTNLTRLNLSYNNISDVSPLAGLTNLTVLRLVSNNISDVSPLVALEGPSSHPLRIQGENGVILSVAFIGNPLSDASINTHIPAMQAKGISVLYSKPRYTPPSTEKITGPWLWMIAPTERDRGCARSIDVDSLAVPSAGIVTEAEIATHGANAGDRIGNFVWAPGQISANIKNNINECLIRIGMIEGNVDDWTAYALLSWRSETNRIGVPMHVGGDDAVKVWLNGEVVHRHAVNEYARGYRNTFEVDIKRGKNLLLVKVSERDSDWSMFVGIDGFESTQAPDIAVDVNGDGVVNVQDLVLVSSRLGQTGQADADVNGDGEVNIQDLVLVAGALGDAAAAPSAFRATATAFPSRATVEQWLAAAYGLPRLDARFQRGIAWLEHLLAALLPEETALLTNYPNPFNPETWIPYELATPAEVTLRIYAVEGALVRRLVLGHRAAGIYRSKSRAAYWDGRNAQGEKVASGVYFYTFSAGDFEATRKMLIRK